MMNNFNQPKEFDAVLGNSAYLSFNAAVLGGIQGVKKRLESQDDKVRLAALDDALKYGDAGIDLVIMALHDSSEDVHQHAARLLRQVGVKGQQALLDYDPCLWFTTLKYWRTEEFSFGNILNTVGVAYLIKNKSQLSSLVKNPQAEYIEAVRCEKDALNSYNNKSVQDIVDVLVNKNKLLKNLKALFIGEFCQVLYRKYHYSKVDICSIYPLLKAYPSLEVLQIRGRLIEEDILKNNSQILDIRNSNGSSILPDKHLKHDKLKTLIVEAARINDKNLTKICNLDLPSLEYFELWLGRGERYNINLDILAPIFSGKLFPNLLLLAIRGTANTSEIAQAIAKSPILNKLRVLELTDGNLTNVGAIALLKTPAVNRLHTLDVSGNRINPGMLEQLSQLKCLVRKDSQFNDRYYSVWE